MSEHDSPESSLMSSDTVKDVFLWRRKKLSLLVLSVATATWVLLDVYQFNFVTVVSWTAMAIVSSLFISGNLVRLFRREEPQFSWLEISEQTAIESAQSIRGSIEGAIRWMFQVSSQREWFVFVRVVAVLWFLSYVGSFFDVLTLLYIGIVLGMSAPVIYVKNEDKIKRWREWAKMKARRFCDVVDEKVFKKMKEKMVHVKEKKGKKVE